MITEKQSVKKVEKSQINTKEQPSNKIGTNNSVAPQSPLLSKDCLTHFISICSGKGGVGKSTCTVNLAVALARMGKKVGIIDADIYGFSIPAMMGIDQKPEMKDDLVLPVERFGVKVVSMGFFVDKNNAVIWRGPMLIKMLNFFFNQVYWDDMDYMLLDLPPGTGDIALNLHGLLPSSKEVIVTTPDMTASSVAERAGSMAIQTKHEIVGIIENMSYIQTESGERNYVFGKGGGTHVANKLNSKLLAEIPLATSKGFSGDNHPSSAIFNTDTIQGQCFQSIVQHMIDIYE